MIKSIYVAKSPSCSQQSLESVFVYAGKGIVGDRNYGHKKEPGQNITLIELEEIQRFNQDYGQTIDESDTRRNIITQGVRLNDLVGKQFTIGEVTLLGTELCEPCSKLGKQLSDQSSNHSKHQPDKQALTSAQVVKGFLNKGGLRCNVLSNGKLEVGMPIVITP